MRNREGGNKGSKAFDNREVIYKLKLARKETRPQRILVFQLEAINICATVSVAPYSEKSR